MYIYKVVGEALVMVETMCMYASCVWSGKGFVTKSSYYFKKKMLKKRIECWCPEVFFYACKTIAKIIIIIVVSTN